MQELENLPATACGALANVTGREDSARGRSGLGQHRGNRPEGTAPGEVTPPGMFGDIGATSIR